MCFLNYIEDDGFDEDDCGEDDNDDDVDEGDGDYKVGDSNGVRDDDVDECDGGYKVGDSNGVRGDDVGLQCKHSLPLFSLGCPPTRYTRRAFVWTYLLQTLQTCIHPRTLTICSMTLHYRLWQT